MLPCQPTYRQAAAKPGVGGCFGWMNRGSVSVRLAVMVTVTVFGWMNKVGVSVSVHTFTFT